jgi:hypothetical protein
LEAAQQLLLVANFSPCKMEERPDWFTPQFVMRLSLTFPLLKGEFEALLPEARKSCARQYPGSGPMGKTYFLRWIEREARKPPGLLEGERFKRSSELI